MTVEGLEKLVFTRKHFWQTVKLRKHGERERKKTESVFNLAQEIFPLRDHGAKKCPSALN
jgi:hypothetical protein